MVRNVTLGERFLWNDLFDLQFTFCFDICIIMSIIS